MEKVFGLNDVLIFILEDKKRLVNFGLHSFWQ